MEEVIITLVKVFLNFIYLFLKLLPNSKKIVMMSRQSNHKNLDFILLGKELEKNYKIIYLCKTLDGKENATLLVRIKYGFHIFKQMYHLATSRVCIIDSYIPIVSLLYHHKKKLTIIQIWHSNGTMKTFGYSSLDKREGTTKKIAQLMNMHKNYDIVLASSEAYKEHLSKGFNIPTKLIKTYTLPRYDLLNNKEYEQTIRKKILKKYPSLQNKENILYAPTFRKEEEDFREHLNSLIESIDLDKYNLIIKLHPLMKISIDSTKVIMDKSFSTFDMLFIADKLISDYSCIIYEAGVRNIPLYFYAYDLNYYKYTRGLALDYSTLPGYTEKEAKKITEDFDKKYDLKGLKRFIDLYIENTNNCTKKIADLVASYM